MSDRRRNHYAFLATTIGYFTLVVLIFIAFWIGYKNIEDQNYFYVLLFSGFLVLIIISQLFKTMIDRITNDSYHIRIRDNQGEPVSINKALDRNLFRTNLIEAGYTMFSSDTVHSLFYRANKDHIKKIVRGYILEIVVYVEKNSEEFYLAIVDEEIQKIQDKLIADKKRVDMMLITQVKDVEELNPDVKSKIAEIVFMRNQTGILSTINVGLHQPSKKAVFLYSEKYNPSLYYKYHVEQIKKMI